MTTLINRLFLRSRLILTVAIFIFFASLILVRTLHTEEEVLHLDRFGDLRVSRPDTRVVQVALWFRGGHPGSKNELLRAELLKGGFIIVELDAERYLDLLKQSSRCTDFGEIIRLGQVVQSQLHLEELVKPVLVGSGSSSSLVFSIAANTHGAFTGVITDLFCPRIAGIKPLCAAAQPVESEKPPVLVPPPPESVTVPMLVLNGDEELAGCVDEQPLTYLQAVRSAHLLPGNPDRSQSAIAQELPRFAGHGEQAGAGEKHLDSLELEELPSEPHGSELIVFVSGDGGWAAIDKELGQYFQERGLSVVGLSSLRYFWREKTPEQTAATLAAIIRRYKRKWGISQVILAGFSLGADILPSAYNRLPDDEKALVKSMILLSPEKKVVFEVILTDWLNIKSEGGFDALPELLQVKIPLTCVYGQKEREGSVCPELSSESARIIELPGGHHFNGDYRALGDTLLRERLQ